MPDRAAVRAGGAGGCRQYHRHRRGASQRSGGVHRYRQPEGTEQQPAQRPVQPGIQLPGRAAGKLGKQRHSQQRQRLGGLPCLRHHGGVQPGVQPVRGSDYLLLPAHRQGAVHAPGGQNTVCAAEAKPGGLDPPPAQRRKPHLQQCHSGKDPGLHHHRHVMLHRRGDPAYPLPCPDRRDRRCHQRDPLLRALHRRHSQHSAGADARSGQGTVFRDFHRGFAAV